MEHKATDTDEEVAKVRDAEDCVMTVVAARSDAPVGKVEEHQIGEGVDDFGGVVGQIVVFFTPLESRCHGIPVTRLIGWWVGYGEEP